MGFQSGYSAGEAKRRSEEPVARVYSVGDIIRETGNGPLMVAGQLDYQPLIDATQTTVAPSEWEALGGPSTMAPIPWLEALVVHATPSIHDQLSAFFEDLSVLQPAIDRSIKEREQMMRAREKWLARILDPIAQQLQKQLSPIPSDIELTGIWQMNRQSSEGISAASQYEFLDEQSVRVVSDDAERQTWYFCSPGSLVIAGQPYIAATTGEGRLVLVQQNQTDSFLIGDRVSESPNNTSPDD